MSNLRVKKEYLAFGIVIVLFLIVSVMSISSISLLQGNARVVNYVGIVRGATQKLIKEEIMGWQLSQNDADFPQTADWYPDDALIARLDSIVDELLTGEGPNNLVVLQGETYLDNMRRVRAHWADLKVLIAEVRAGADPQRLFDSSQEYFELVNETVFSAEAYSEAQVARITTILIIVNVVFILLIVAAFVIYARSLTTKRRADALGKIAYIDPLTGLDNRASCERLIERLQSEQPETDIAVFMFDMNNLKQTNDVLGHQGGDQIISAFAKMLAMANDGGGFVGRFGGDEFLAIFEPGSADIADAYLRNVRELVDAYNNTQSSELEMIHYAAGYALSTLQKQDMEDIIHDADNQMYISKRQSKKG
ncbi:GGDEF domain-containing protein [Oscillospiraceae bacterium OttesenSCG-928-G22]|nr:GGDEF domain-containing protein [Oscillospiraceae bacterium OttesenSCG-928-G22]